MFLIFNSIKTSDQTIQYMQVIIVFSCEIMPI